MPANRRAALLARAFGPAKFVSLLAFLTVVLCSTPASALLIATLDDWNTTELQAVGDTLTVNTTSLSNCEAGALFCYAIDYVDADPTSGPTAKAIILFGYTDTGAATAPSTHDLTGTLTAWDLNDSGNVAGFGVFDVVDDKGPGNETALHFFLGTTVALSSESSSFRYVAHLQYVDDCSGFVGTSAPTGMSSKQKCGTVPEPGTLVLLGSGLSLIGVLARRQYQAGRGRDRIRADRI
jgi:PEP-CTERM motif